MINVFIYTIFMKQFIRTITPQIKEWLFKGKVIIVYGARRVGKTTLVRQLNDEFGTKLSYINCDIIRNRDILQELDPKKLRAFLGEGTFFVLDEAQNVPNIGVTLKLLIDTYPDIQIIATGSSSFDLVNKVGEPLTGRSRTFYLYPLTMQEIMHDERYEVFDSILESKMIYGSYPEIVATEPYMTKRILIEEVVNAYLYKDILTFDAIRKPRLVMDIVKMLALQIGNEVSQNEIATTLGVSRGIVERYLDVLEKVFIIYSLPSLNTNIRSEIAKKRKYYFYDLGIRNAVIGNFSDLADRTDIGALWENVCIIDRIQCIKNKGEVRNGFFWRSTISGEIDYVEQYNGVTDAYECKYKKDSMRMPPLFMDTYKPKKVAVVNRNTVRDFLLS